MKLSEEEKRKYEDLYQSLYHSAKVRRMDEIPQHRGSTSFEHSFKVVKAAFKKAIKKRKTLDLEAIIVGAAYHDYFLYNWRVDRAKLKRHGRNHPGIALKNAMQDYDLTSLEKEIIATHMWPLNIKKFPYHTESKIVSISDKMVSTKEALTSKRYKRKHHDKTLKYLATLF